VIYDIDHYQFKQTKEKIQNFIKGFAPKDTNGGMKKGKYRQ